MAVGWTGQGKPYDFSPLRDAFLQLTRTQIERLNKCTLDEFMQKNIWTPLGMTSTTFRLEKRPDLMSRKVDMTRRKRDGSFISVPQPYDFPAEHDLGGIGAYSTLEDYGKLLRALLQDGAGILKPESVDEIFIPQLDDTLGEIHHPIMHFYIPAEIKMNFGLSVSVRIAPMKGRREAGSGSWGGYPNITWWLDRKTGVAGTVFRQTVPPGDPIAFEFDDKFETAVYEYIQAQEGGKGKL